MEEIKKRVDIEVKLQDEITDLEEQNPEKVDEKVLMTKTMGRKKPKSNKLSSKTEQPNVK